MRTSSQMKTEVRVHRRETFRSTMSPLVDQCGDSAQGRAVRRSRRRSESRRGSLFDFPGSVICSPRVRFLGRVICARYLAAKKLMTSFAPLRPTKNLPPCERFSRSVPDYKLPRTLGSQPVTPATQHVTVRLFRPFSSSSRCKISASSARRSHHLQHVVRASAPNRQAASSRPTQQ